MFSAGKLLVRRVRIAVSGRDDHVADFYTFTETLPATSVLEWKAMVEKWEKHPKECPNPFVQTTRSK